MAKKKRVTKKSRPVFQANPFSSLKGFAASAEKEKAVPPFEDSPVSPDAYGTFADEMEMLGVKRLKDNVEIEQNAANDQLSAEDQWAESKKLSDEELFLSAMTSLNVNFKDKVQGENRQHKASPRRMKQLKKGRIKPQARLDLHGCKRQDVFPRLTHYLQNARHQGWETLLVVTGKGLHSEGGEPVLRMAVEEFLVKESPDQIVEWGRAPKEYGGDGALILFLKQKN
jgi:DNA-nicking Smr family endonuclease